MNPDLAAAIDMLDSDENLAPPGVPYHSIRDFHHDDGPSFKSIINAFDISKEAEKAPGMSQESIIRGLRKAQLEALKNEFTLSLCIVLEQMRSPKWSAGFRTYLKRQVEIFNERIAVVEFWIQSLFSEHTTCS